MIQALKELFKTVEKNKKSQRMHIVMDNDETPDDFVYCDECDIPVAENAKNHCMWCDSDEA